MSTKDLPVAISKENQAKTSKEASPCDTSNDSLFLRLQPELWRLVFGWIGPDDMKTYIRLAATGDRGLAHYIYTESTHLWKVIDLAKFPGITDAQLESLLERVNAVSVTQCIIFDKNPTTLITGRGLEPLRHSRVLESIDLRQTTSVNVGPTWLDDRYVPDLLSTMIPHKLTSIKVRKQFDSSFGAARPDKYCFSWSAFFANFKLNQARNSVNEVCSHCNASLVPLSTQQVLRTNSTQCTVCNLHSCKAWTPWKQSSCPAIQECKHCREFCCSCRQVVTCDYCQGNSCSECDQNQLTCQYCGNCSCSECEEVKQCKKCRETGCKACAVDISTCGSCNDTFCEGCKDIYYCGYCEKEFCEDCSDFVFCEYCGVAVCKDCQKGKRGVVTAVKCEDCYCGSCADCRPLSYLFRVCSFCGLYVCKDDDCSCQAMHVCVSPGKAVFNARDAEEGDDENNLCACGKKHLSSLKGQRFMCAFQGSKRRKIG